MHKLRKLKRPLATLLLFAFLSYYIANNQESLSAIKEVPLIALLVIAFMKVAFILLTGLLMDVVLKNYGKEIKVRETFYLSILSASGNYFGPLLGGTSIRAVYLKKKHNLPYSKFLSALASYYVVLFISVSVIALGSLAYLHLAEDKYIPLGYLFFVSLPLVVIGILIFEVSLLPRIQNLFPKKLSKMFSQISEGWKSIRQNKRLVYKLFLLGLANIVAQAIIVWVEFSLFADSFSAANVLIYTAISLVTILFALTPGAVGIREGLLLLSTSAIGLTTANVLEISLIDRGVSLIVLSVLLMLTRFEKMKRMIT